MPPASVMPPIPTEPVSPKPVASPCSPAATRVLAGGEARARPGRAPGGVQLERAQRREVDHDAAVGDAVARGAVAAAADRELGPGLAGVRR